MERRRVTSEERIRKAWEDLGRLLSVAQQMWEGLCLVSSELWLVANTDTDSG